jgi:hypothetical protein
MTTPRTRTTRPKSSVALDLDAIENERHDEPFTVNIGGTPVTFISVRELDWQVAANLSDDRPFEFFETVVREEDQDHFLAQKIPVWKMDHLMKAYRAHFGLPEPGESRG